MDIGTKMEKKVRNPWNFDQPPYDQRSSKFVNAGFVHGVGHRNPVGTEKVSTKGPIKFGCYRKEV